MLTAMRTLFQAIMLMLTVSDTGTGMEEASACISRAVLYHQGEAGRHGLGLATVCTASSSSGSHSALQ